MDRLHHVKKTVNEKKYIYDFNLIINRIEWKINKRNEGKVKVNLKTRKKGSNGRGEGGIGEEERGDGREEEEEEEVEWKDNENMGLLRRSNKKKNVKK